MPHPTREQDDAPILTASVSESDPEVRLTLRMHPYNLDS